MAFLGVLTELSACGRHVCQSPPTVSLCLVSYSPSSSLPPLLSPFKSFICLFFLPRYSGPLITDTIADSLGAHLSSSDPQVFVIDCFTYTPAGDSGLLYVWFLWLLLVFVCAPSALNASHQSFLLSSPLKFLFFLVLLLLCSLTLHLSTWQVTRSGPPADWLIGGLSSLSIFLQSHAMLDQDRADQPVTWPRAQSFRGNEGSAPKTCSFPQIL